MTKSQIPMTNYQSAYALHATDHNILVPANTLVHNPRYLVESSA